MYIYIYINYIYNIYINKRINMHIYNIYITTIYIHINVYVYIWYMFIYICVSFTISPRLHFNLKGIIQILFWNRFRIARINQFLVGFTVI